MAHCSAMLCPQVTLSGDAEWPKVADAVIEAAPGCLVVTDLVEHKPAGDVDGARVRGKSVG